MEFLKKFFNDDGKRVGLCKFDLVKQKHQNMPITTDFCFNPFQAQKTFETDFTENILLV